VVSEPILLRYGQGNREVSRGTADKSGTKITNTIWGRGKEGKGKKNHGVKSPRGEGRTLAEADQNGKKKDEP